MPQRFLFRRLYNASSVANGPFLTDWPVICRHRTAILRTAYFSSSSHRNNDSTNPASNPSVPPSTTKESSSSTSDTKSEKKFFETELDQPEYDAYSHTSMPKNFGTNQYMEINEELRSRLRQVLWQFKAPIRYAVAYGSGVFSQGKNTRTSSSDKPMIDLLFGVTYTQHWHSLNLMEHRKHYSSLGTLGSGMVSFVQDRIGAGVYFNPYVEMNGMVRLSWVSFESRRMICIY